jgi:2-polyprenyl-3-methyl-5-hydroxy-6-metoxy-1,4-benzoquinol methylase
MSACRGFAPATREPTLNQGTSGIRMYRLWATVGVREPLVETLHHGLVDADQTLVHHPRKHMTPHRSSSHGTDSAQARIAREAKAFDEGRAVENNLRWVARVPHVKSGANSRHGDQRFRGLISERVVGGRVLDVGCGTGDFSAELHAMGAGAVYGFDVSRRHIQEARAKYGALEGVTFSLHGADAPIDGRFDVIVGQAILHHLDFRTILVKLFEEDLLPGGRMIFMEPMGHPFTLAFHRFVPSAHTPDEWPITPSDVAWLQHRFAARVIPINLLSFPAGIVSSFALRSADNSLMRLADRVDRGLERRRRFLARGRQGIVIIDRHK